MSGRAFPITLGPSPVRLVVRSSVKLFSKPISSYSFGWISLKFYTGIKYNITNVCLCSFDDRTIFEFLGNVRNFDIMV